MNKVNIGIIGLGNQGKKHLENCISLENVEIRGVADVSKKALNFAKKKGVKKLYKNYSELLEDDKIDAVIISLPNFLHYEGVLNAAEAGKDILLEKPLARNIEEGKLIESCVKKNSIKLMMGYNTRFHPAFVELYKKIEAGYLGEVITMNGTNISNGPFSSLGNSEGPVPVNSWWFDKELTGGGALIDLGPHLISVLNWYFGEVKESKAFLGYTFNLDVEDTATCVIKYKNGPIATVNVGWFSKETTVSLQLFGTSKHHKISLAPSNTTEKVYRDIKSKFSTKNKKSIYNELEYFVDCIAKNIQPVPSVDDGLKVLSAISMGYNNSAKY